MPIKALGGTMGWFIIQCERKTWIKYIVEAENQNAALQTCDNWEYLGYLDGEETNSQVIDNPFPTEEAALADIASYVEG